MRIIILPIATIAILMTSCSTAYRCPLNNEEGYCSSVAATHSAALVNEGDKENVLAGFAQPAGEDANNSELQYKTSSASPGSSLSYKKSPRMHDADRKPVYNPARVWRLWTAPWQDSKGFLHSGENLYFNTPGSWNYGTLRKPGAASHMLEPITAENMGFNDGSSTSSDGIIQPKQKLFGVKQ